MENLYGNFFIMIFSSICFKNLAVLTSSVLSLDAYPQMTCPEITKTSTGIILSFTVRIMSYIFVSNGAFSSISVYFLGSMLLCGAIAINFYQHFGAGRHPTTATTVRRFILEPVCTYPSITSAATIANFNNRKYKIFHLAGFDIARLSLFYCHFNLYSLCLYVIDASHNISHEPCRAQSGRKLSCFHGKRIYRITLSHNSIF